MKPGWEGILPLGLPNQFNIFYVQSPWIMTRIIKNNVSVEESIYFIIYQISFVWYHL